MRFKDTDCIYRRWNSTTAMCYKNRMRCSICDNKSVCEKDYAGNKYKIKMIKYAVLKTYANIGTKGLDKYLKEFVRNL